MGKVRSAKKGEPDVGQFARMVLNDWQRSKLPFYEAPKCFEVPLSRQSENVSRTTENDEEQEKKNDTVPETVSNAD